MGEGPTDGGRTDGGWSEHADVVEPDHLRERFPGYDDQIVHARTVPAEAAETVPAEDVLPADLADGLGHDLYSHQAEALRHLCDGEHVVVSTATASGKTLVYALYVALCRREDPDARALFCYPTKALARDQQGALTELYDDLGLDVEVAVYDGDTPQNRRRAIRSDADVVVTNFAGINVYLEHHVKWREAFANCALLAVDEAHAYTGIHGMHVAWTLRRLRRLLDYYGSDPRLVCTSATIGNPAEHARRLTGAPHAVVDEDGSPRGRREIVLWDPPIEDDLDEQFDLHEYLGAKQRAGEASAELAAHLGLHDVQSLAFTRSRQGTELAAKTARRAAREHPASGSLEVEPYHAGHGKHSRRETERRLQSGALDAVCSTSALELGIDVGGVDAAILAGYPGSRQSFWQRIGRAGRGTEDALSVLVARADAIDQYVLDDPDYLFEADVEDADEQSSSSPDSQARQDAAGASSGEPSDAGAYEDAVVDLANDVVYARHLLCAAAELPLSRDDERWFGGGAVPDDELVPEDRLERAVEMWRDAGVLVGTLDRGVQYDGAPRPQADVSMYATSGETFDVRGRDCELEMEPIDRERAYREFHPGALVLHEGTEYEVVELEEDGPQPHVVLQRVSTNEYTRTHSRKSVSDLEVRRTRDLGDGYRLRFGVGTVGVHYAHYERRDVATGELVGPPQPTGLPPIELRTQLTWIETPGVLRERVLEAVPAADHLDAPGDYSPAVDRGAPAADAAVETTVDAAGGTTADDAKEPAADAANEPPADAADDPTADVASDPIPELAGGAVPGTGAATALPDDLSAGDVQYTFLGGLHGAEHAMIELAPLALRLDSSDVGGLSVDPHPETGVPTWFVHDTVDGGIGFARGIYEHADELVARTREHVASCDCDGVRGCPACLMDVQCGNRNEPLHTTATVEILAALEERLD